MNNFKGYYKIMIQFPFYKMHHKKYILFTLIITRYIWNGY